MKEERLYQAFRVFDQNNDGFISIEEFNAILQDDPSFKDMTMDQVKDLMKEADRDGDGKVSHQFF